MKEKITIREQKDFTAYLQRKDLAPDTIKHYQWYVSLFFKWTEKEEIQITKADILKYLEYLKTRKQQQNISRKNNLIALNHYFTFLYQSEVIAENPCLFLKIRGTKKKTLYKTYSPEELDQLYDNFYHLFVKNYDDSHIPQNQRRNSLLSKERNAVMLNLLINQGTTTKELDRIILKDIDLHKAVIKIRGGRKSNERNIPLKATQIGLLMHYTQNIRSQFFDFYEGESDKLFLPLPESGKATTQSKSMMGVYKAMTKQVKTLDKNFLNFKQTRASVIVQWLKTQGLRKTQYLAGHRYISSTEHYALNNLEGLTDDIAKHHPF